MNIIPIFYDFTNIFNETLNKILTSRFLDVGKLIMKISIQNTIYFINIYCIIQIVT